MVASEQVKLLFRRIRVKFGKDIGNSVIEMILDELSGLRLIFPTAREVGRWRRDLEIIRLFDGVNIQELAERFGITSRQVRYILKRESEQRTREDDNEEKTERPV